MNPGYVLTPSAARDLDEIFSYVLERSGPRRALHVHQRLEVGFRRIAQHTTLGHRRSDLGDNALRAHVVFKYVIVYDPETRPVQIIRVIHGARDLPRAIQ